MKRILFMTFVPILEGDGISNKILSQVSSLKKEGFEVSLGKVEITVDKILYKIDDIIIATFPKNNVGKLELYFQSFDKVLIYCKQHRVNYVYLRYFLLSSPQLVSFLKELKKNSIKIYLEIPTYPYDGERNTNSMIGKIKAYIDNRYRKKIAQYLNKIVTYSDDEKIWGCKTIQISNAVNIDNIPLHQTPELGNEFHIIGVAVLAKWHGYDRVLEGIKKYNSEGGYKIVFHIVGRDSQMSYYKELRKMVDELGIGDNVVFHGTLSGNALDKVFNQSHMAIGSLGRHRNGIRMMRSLKNVEYAMRGIPFIYSENNADFDGQPYILKITPDESAVDLHMLIDFYTKHSFSPLDIRKTALGFSWEAQMHKVCQDMRREED